MSGVGRSSNVRVFMNIIEEHDLRTRVVHAIDATQEVVLLHDGGTRLPKGFLAAMTSLPFGITISSLICCLQATDGSKRSSKRRVRSGKFQAGI